MIILHLRKGQSDRSTYQDCLTFSIYLFFMMIYVQYCIITEPQRHCLFLLDTCFIIVSVYENSQSSQLNGTQSQIPNPLFETMAATY